MARKKIQSATDQRPFVMVYQDFLESDVLDNNYQKLIYIYIKKFADSKNQCYPSIKTLSKLTKISVNKVKITLNELETKGVIVKENRVRPDGGKTSNLYTLYDYKEIWSVGSNEEVPAVINEIEEKKLIDLLKAKGYTITKEKEIVCEPTKAHTQSLELNQFNIVNTTINSKKSQYLERYNMEQLKDFYCYNTMINDNPYMKKDIDSVLNILYNILNTSKDTIKIGGEEKPIMVIISKLMKLNYENILYSIWKFKEQKERIYNTTNYMLKILYNSEEQMHLDITNQVQHNMNNYNYD